MGTQVVQVKRYLTVRRNLASLGLGLSLTLRYRACSQGVKLPSRRHELFNVDLTYRDTKGTYFTMER